jgi:hypothetical protein
MTIEEVVFDQNKAYSPKGNGLFVYQDKKIELEYTKAVVVITEDRQ